MHILSLFLPLLFLASCHWNPFAAPQSTKLQVLEQSYAQVRSKNIASVHYDLSFDLRPSSYFNGQARIEFDLKNSIELKLDFNGKKIKSLAVNGKSPRRIKYDHNYIYIPTEVLALGKNVIEISYTGFYSSDGYGLHRFKDPVDQKDYLYTNFEPYAAHRLFPCFDQPDLKATYNTQVKAPKGWTVISSNKETKIEDHKKYRLWEFKEDLAFSTYVYSLHAGHYHVWKSQAKTKNQTIPLRLFARQSMKSQIQPKNWFQLTEKGLRFFEDYFGTPYPYRKYDQVLVPDFPAAGMENVAAVTLNEHFVKSKSPDRNLQFILEKIILHEMAHMWFGNLVTMKWWNDLWLKESFATYMSYKSMAHISEFKDEAWIKFLLTSKNHAYINDQLSITHSIEAPVSNTSVATASFDAITYGKGAAVLKQLSYYVGEESFKKGLQRYFKNFAHKNTDLNDFMLSMEYFAKKELIEWSNQWLRTPRLNLLHSQFKCKDGKVESFEIKQDSIGEFMSLRPHRFQVGFLSSSDEKLKLDSTFATEILTDNIKEEKAIGKACPDMVYLNLNDHGYFKTQFSQSDIKILEEHFSSLKDNDLLRALVWMNLWDMLRDQHLGLHTFINFLKQGLEEEHHASILSFIHDTLPKVFDLYYPKNNPDELKTKQENRNSIEKIYLAKIKSTKPQPELQKAWFVGALGFVSNPQSLSFIHEVLTNEEAQKNLSFILDQELRWRSLHTLSRRGHEKAEVLIANELDLDTSSIGKKNSLVALASKPDLKVKEKFFKILTNNTTTYSLAELRAIMFGLFPFEQSELKKLFIDRIYEYLQKNKNQGELKAFARHISPFLCQPKNGERLINFAHSNDLSPSITKSLQFMADEDKRCVMIKLAYNPGDKK